jgi:hypothetical protein
MGLKFSPKNPIRSDRHRARPRVGLICLTIMVDEVDVPSCSPALNKSLAPFIICRRNFAGIGRKKYSAQVVGELRKKRGKQRTMLSEAAGTAISQGFWKIVGPKIEAQK